MPPETSEPKEIVVSRVGDGQMSLTGTTAPVFIERRKIADALRTHDGNKTRAAEDLGVSYKTLLTKIKEYEL